MFGLTTLEYIMKYSSQMLAPKLRSTTNGKVQNARLMQVRWMTAQIPRAGLPSVM